MPIPLGLDLHDHASVLHCLERYTSRPSERSDASRHTWYQRGHPLFDVPHFTMFARVNHARHVRNSDTGFGNVCSFHQLRIGQADLQITIFLIPRGGISNTAP